MNDSYLMHYGTPRHSGRYPWGSGEHPYQGENFYTATKKLKDSGLSEVEIAKLYGMSTTEYRKRRSLAKTEHKEKLRALNAQLEQEGLNRSERARKLGVNESTVRSWENENSIKREQIVSSTKEVLERNIAEKKYIDVGDGVASGMGITKNRLDTAVQAMVDDGYELHNIKVEQVNNPGKFTTVAVLCEPGTTKKQLYEHSHEIGLVNEKFDNSHGLTSLGMKPPKSISGKKVQVVTLQEGGADKDGLIEIRRGAKGLDMGNAKR